jgi:hypothetical protein
MSDRFLSDAQLDAALAAADPLVPGSLDSAGVARAVADLAGTVAPMGVVSGPRMASRWVGARQFWRPATLGLAVVVAATVVSLLGLGGQSGRVARSDWLVTVTPAQASELDRLAAATSQEAGPGKGQWLYQRYEMFAEEGLSWQRGAFVAFHTMTETQHWSRGRVQRWRTVTIRFAFDTPRDRVTYLKYRSHFLPGLNDEGGVRSGRVTDTAEFRPSTSTSPLYSPQEFPDTKLGIMDRFKQLVTADEARLPPSRFRAQLKAQLSSGLFGVLLTILEQSTSQRQRAAAFRALAYVRDVQILGSRKDIRGRIGVAVRLDEGDSVETLIVNRLDGDLLQDTQENFPPTGNHVTIFRTVYLDRAVVKSMTTALGGRTVPYHGPQPKTGTRTSSR